MYSKTITEFGFCDIRNFQGLGRCNQPWSPASADNTCLDLDYSIQLLFIIIHCTHYQHFDWPRAPAYIESSRDFVDNHDYSIICYVQIIPCAANLWL